MLAAVALQLAAAAYLRERRVAWLGAWALFGPVAVLLSFPAVFVFGASAAAILTGMPGAPWEQRGIWLAGCALTTLAFVGMFWATSSSQYDSLRTPMTTYWQDSFPPAIWWKIPRWLLEIHAGNMMAYPVGGKNWGSAGTLLLCVIGIFVSVKKWSRPLHLLFILPFAFTLLAAALHLYPYGGSARISQHLAPAICLWAGLGSAWLIKTVQFRRWRRGNVLAVFGFLGVIGVMGMALDFLRPAKTPGDFRARQIVREWTAPAQAVQAHLIWEPMPTLSPTFQWYLRTSGSKIFWNAREDDSWASLSGPLQVLSFDRDIDLATKFPGFRLTEEHIEDILVGPPEMGPDRWQSLRLEPSLTR